MDIIIDSNVFKRDLKLKDKNFEILNDYLSKTQSKVILPKIVLEEIKNLYKKTLKDNFNTYATSVAKLLSTLISPEEYSKLSIDVDIEATKYVEYINEKLNITSHNIIDYKNEYLPELVRRAINRVKPLGEDGQQFRDGLLWLTILDYASTTENKELIFISTNSNDFAEKNSTNLHKDLLKECEERGVAIHYYLTVEDFIATQASKIEFINDDWISENVDKEKIEELFISILSDTHKDYIKDSVELDHNEHLTGYINRTDYIYSTIYEHYVYEKLDGEILLKLSVEFETEYELEIERTKERDESRYDYRYVINPRTGEEDYIMDYIPDYSVNFEQDVIYKNPIFIGYFTISIKDQKIVEIEVTDWENG